MSTRSSIWYSEANGKTVHIYWELGERESEDGRMTAPLYIEASSGETGEQIAVRLPKDVAMKLLMVLSSNWTTDVKQVL